MKQSTGGFALIVALSLVVVLAIVLVTYSTLTVGNVRTSASSGNATAGFYAAEAALNARAEQVRQKFKGFQAPTGASPTSVLPCKGTNLGTGDYACQNATVGGRLVTSYASVGTTQSITIPQGEDFEFLNAQETPTTVYGQATGTSGNPEAIASLVFRSRLVPLFQFAVFFDKDLEFTNTATLDLSGPVHTNGNLFLDSGNGSALSINGQTTASKGVYRGWKHDNGCTGTVNIADDGGTARTLSCGSGRTQVAAATMKSTFGNQLKTLPVLDVPTVADMQPRSTAQYWQKADARVVLKLTSGSSSAGVWTPNFVRVDGTKITGTAGVSCTTALTSSQTFRDNREAQYWEDTTKGNVASRAKKVTLDIDVPNLLACMQANRTGLGLNSSGIAETTEGGLVLYLTFDDSSGSSILNSVLSGGTASGSISQGSGTPNNYAVRLRNGSTLRSATSSDPVPAGLTVVTDQAMIVEGDFNAGNTRAQGWIPASLIADSINVLSNAWKSTQNCQYQVVFNGTTRKYWMTQTQKSTGTPTTWAWYKPPGSGGQWMDYSLLNSSQRTYASSLQTNLPVSMPLLTGTGATQQWYAYSTATHSSASTYADVSPAGDGKSALPLWCRNVVASTNSTTSVTAGSIVHAAVLAGTATTGDEGGLYPDPTLPAQSGGVHNMMRFSEDWGANSTNPNGTVDYAYTGSLVSLNQPLHAIGDFKLGDYRFYNPPRRVWTFEAQFRDAANLPPLTPRFVYLKQDNFTRQFEQP